ncbi:MAG: hypothetical protein ABF649_00765 [Bacillus sp. (in: firmicutes)]
MARGNMRPQPWVKNIEVYTDFSGGLNSVTDHTKMADKEVAELVNMDISPRGTLRRRSGMIFHQRRANWGDIKGKTWGELNEMEV